MAATPPVAATARRCRGGQVAAAAVLAVGLALLAAGCPRWADTTGSTPSGSASSGVPGSAAFGVPVEELDLEVIQGDLVRRHDGTQVRLQLPGQFLVRAAARVPGGYLVEVVLATAELWYAPEDAPARRIGPLSSHWSWTLSPDGRVLVVSGIEISPERLAPTTAYQLPNLRVLGKQERGWDPIGVAGHLVLLQPGGGLQLYPPAAVWDLATGALHDVSFRFAALDVTDAGEVLAYQNRSTTEGSVGCVFVVALADLLHLGNPDGLGGSCGRELLGAWIGWISPNGAFAVLPVQAANAPTTRTSVVDVAQLRAGRLASTPIVVSGQRGSAPSLVWLRDVWDTDSSFIVEETVFAGRTGDYYRCQTNGRCTPLVMPAGMRDAQPVLRYDG